MDRRLTIIEAPLAVETHFSGVELMAEALLQAGLAERLGARQVLSLPRAHWPQRRDLDTGIISPHETSVWLQDLAETTGRCHVAGGFPLVLGGDCTILLGCLLAQKRMGGGGLFFVDGHADLLHPDTSLSGETADMDLALALGRGPAVLADLGGAGPLVQEARTVVFGYRDEALVAAQGGPDPKTLAVNAWSLADIRTRGFGNACGQALDHLLLSHDERFWLHVDLDVLDDAVMPAVDYRMPGGLSAGELVVLVRRALATGRVCGMDVTIFNPTLDWDGSLTTLLADMLVTAFDRN